MTKIFSVEYSKKASKVLDKMDAFDSRLILSWIDKNLVGCVDPRAFGKGLSGDRSAEWRYRVGDYRIIAEIKDDEVLILVVTIGHRRDIYKKA